MVSDAQFHSAIYEGRLQHRRHRPAPHAFTHPLTMLYLDLDEWPRLLQTTRAWSYESFNCGALYRRDYHGDPSKDLRVAIQETVQAALGRMPVGPIRLLTHARYFGFCFNPVSFYYCFAANGETLDCIVAEITNTPWNERHCYVLDVQQSAVHHPWWQWEFDKAFHVSPFLPMNLRYDWRFTPPQHVLGVHMNVNDASGNKAFDANLQLTRREWTRANLHRVLWRFPWMTAQVMFGIHWQALRLWLKRNPVFNHPALSDKKP